MQQAFLRGSTSTKDKIMSNIQKKFKIVDRMISPFTEMEPTEGADDKSVTNKIINAERDLKEQVKRNALAASQRAQDRRQKRQSPSLHFAIGMANIEEQQKSIKH